MLVDLAMKKGVIDINNEKITHKGTVPLETERLMLRRLKLDDAQAVYDTWASDPEVTKYLPWNAHSSVEVTIKWLWQVKKEYNDTACYDWGIVLKETGQLIGSMGAVREDGEPDRIEMGYCIGKPYWNRGYATEALRRIIRYLSEDVGIKHFTAKHAAENPASGAVMRHARFRYVKSGYYKSFDGLREYECKIYYLDIE